MSGAAPLAEGLPVQALTTATAGGPAHAIVVQVDVMQPLVLPASPLLCSSDTSGGLHGRVPLHGYMQLSPAVLRAPRAPGQILKKRTT